jgi:multiple sugar transport system substrate-binding protein
MKYVFGIAAILFAVMYGIAQATLNSPDRGHDIHLRWATDPNPARDEQTAGFDRACPGTTVAVDPGMAGDATKTIVQCATGTGPDLVDMYGEANLRMYVQAGILLDLTPYAKQMGFGSSATYPSIKDDLEVDGKQYLFPCNVNANAVIYNKKIFDDHGVPYPKAGWTYDDFVKTCKLLQERPSKSGQKDIPFANTGGTGMVTDIILGQGGRWFTPDGLRSAADSPEDVAALQRYRDMIYIQKVIPTPADAASMSSQGGWGSGGIDWFASGRAGMIMIGRWFTCQLPQYPNLAGNLGSVTLPRVGNRPSCGGGGTRAAGINVKSPHWRAALKFLQYLASDQYGKMIVRQGDSLPPSPRVARDGKDLVCPLEEDPAFQQTFIDAVKNARNVDYSPFIDPTISDRYFGDAIQKVENNLETPQRAMHELADRIDLDIRVNLERRPDLQKLFEQRTGKKYTPDWWRSAP